jgi:hypothetical protein
MSKVYFSLRDANEMVKHVAKELELIDNIREELTVLDSTKIEFCEKDVECLLLGVELNKSFHEKNLELYAKIGGLIKMGCVVKDLEELDIDFRSKLGNKDIMLCWRRGEEEVMHWHEIHEECDKRKSIEEIKQKYLDKLGSLV